MKIPPKISKRIFLEDLNQVLLFYRYLGVWQMKTRAISYPRRALILAGAYVAASLLNPQCSSKALKDSTSLATRVNHSLFNLRNMGLEEMLREMSNRFMLGN